MGRQFSAPLIIDNGEERQLSRLRFDDRSYNEDWLQRLLFKYPSLVPIDEFEPAFLDHVAVCRELPTPAGPVDLFYVNPSGFMTFVETKLWRNPEARRKVVAQIIDYAKEVSRWTYDELVDAVRRATKVDTDDPLVALVEDADEFDEREFVDSINRNLRLGRVLLLIVGDGIREDAENIIDFLQQTPQLRFSLGLVEIGLFPLDPDEPERLLVQPRIVARTQEVTRAVVEIKAPVKPSDVVVTLPKEPSERRRRGGLTEELFFEQLEELGKPEVVSFARWALDNAADHELMVVWGDAGPIFKYVSEDGTAFAFFQLHKDGVLRGAKQNLYGRCKKLGLPLEIATDFMDATIDLIPGAVRKSFTTPKGITREMIVRGPDATLTQGPPLERLAPNKEKWFADIDSTIERLRKALDE